jgi:hypothetical protein
MEAIARPDGFCAGLTPATMAIQVHGLRVRDTLRSVRAGVGVMRPGSSRYLRGTRPSEEPVTIHAAELHGQDEHIALCDRRAVKPLPGRFDPGDPAACPHCRSLAA